MVPPRTKRIARCKYVIGLTAAMLFRQQCHEAFAGFRATSSPSRLARTGLADGELPTGDELLEAAEQVREQEVINEVLPKLPDWADFLVGKFLLLMPVIVLGSWAAFTYWSYKESARQKEEDDKRKLKKALKLDPNWSKEAVAKRDEKKRKKRKMSAFQEALKLEEEAAAER
mmetsp:Transcript_12292/g.14939  ORF Transcript_12292/g.14939 Transcript_12292/m.14939 type:complete len:172 (-) Transcript_12292:85-600(-)